MYTQNKHYIPLDQTSDLAFNMLFPGLEKNYDFPEGEILGFFNHVYHDGFFIDALEELLVRQGNFGYDYCYGYYPDQNSGYPNEYFEEGLVRFALGWDDEKTGIYTTEREFFQYAKEACRRFLKYHPEFHDYIMDILNNWKPKYPEKFKSYLPDDIVLLPDEETTADFTQQKILRFFNQIYRNGDFLRALMNLVQSNASFFKGGCSGFYPNWDVPFSNLHFDKGLICFLTDKEEKGGAYLTERQFFRYAKEACLRFVELHPEHRDFVMNIVDNWKPKYPDKFPD